MLKAAYGEPNAGVTVTKPEVPLGTEDGLFNVIATLAGVDPSTGETLTYGCKFCEIATLKLVGDAEVNDTN